MKTQYLIIDIIESIVRIKLVRSVIYLFIATLTLAPVHRLPFVNSGIIKDIKFIVLAFWVLGVTMFFLSCKMGRLRKRVFYYSRETLFFIILMMCYLGLMFFHSSHTNMLSAKDSGFNEAAYSFVLVGMATITTFLALNYKINFYKLLAFSASIIIVLCATHVVSVCFSFDQYVLAGFQGGGFAILKTTWSNSIALYAILIPVYVSTKTTSNIKLFSSFVYGSLPIILSQLVAGGRAGLAASSFAVTAWMIYVLPVRYILLIFFLIAIAVVFIDSAYIYSYNVNMILGTYAHDIDYDFFNELLARRLDHWMFGLEIIRDNPLTGVGLGNALIDIPGHADNRHPIHNVLLRLTAELGLFFLIIVISHLMYIKYCLMRILPIINSYKTQLSHRVSYRIDGVYIRSSAIIIISALFITIFEPKYVWTGLGSSWLFWIMASILIFYAKNVWLRQF